MFKTIKIFGDKYRIRKTYDIDDYGIGVYGYEIYTEKGKFLIQAPVKKMDELKSYLKFKIYKVYY